MSKKKKIGVVFLPSEWTGGVYYILNFISALNYLTENNKPHVFLFCRTKKDYDFVVDQTGYPLLQFITIPDKIVYSFFQRLINKAGRMVLGKNLIEKRFHTDIDILFPYSYDPFFELISNKVYWLPDLQDKFFPAFFDEPTLKARDLHYRKLAEIKGIVVFSSKAALDDYKTFYPHFKFTPFILHFASVPHTLIFPDKEIILKKYHLPERYFYTPNQFWKHKNHDLVLDSALILKQQGADACFVFSGNENDPRNPGYFKSLKEKVRSYGLEKNVFFLGFIDREDVFTLMKYSQAVIQPSLFEGWSTVVEDALSVNAFLLLSDLKVNREQIDKNVLFFDTKDSRYLVDSIRKIQDKRTNLLPYDYSKRVQQYANDISRLINFSSEHK